MTKTIDKMKVHSAVYLVADPYDPQKVEIMRLKKLVAAHQRGWDVVLEYISKAMEIQESEIRELIDMVRPGAEDET